ncbi:unnamed protein product [Alternaria alternata]|uniref:Uncharacterized protein n=1 Tax=Alternaria tenuissima TaxID=119927 RepID=A0A4Q4RLZ8_9PLEO|nr:hypothetical protein AALT_g6795 [Alternaria alternata]RYN55269.1 hypothetical protein AA0118_g8880 [Alternaria tenuissima]RYN58006.1 hypothetical protein AA0114_g2141 [Alternaria tenuissima]RYO57950.1 hypothetical protein AA0116_g7511 [Alternaria tenuissima]
MSQNETNEAIRKQWETMKRKEKEMMRLCDDIQVRTLAYYDNGKHLDDERAFLETCGRSLHNQTRIQDAWDEAEAWLAFASDNYEKLVGKVDKLKKITTVRKKLQEQLGIAPTEDGYFAYGKVADTHRGDGAQKYVNFVLLDHELDSTTSVRHYIAENMGGSSLLTNEEWRPQVWSARPDR